MSPERRIVIGLFAVALGLRVLYSAVLATQPDIKPDPATPDFNYATEITSGFEWVKTPFSPRAPGYPLILALFLLLSAKQLWLAVFLQAVVGAASVVLVYYIGVPLLGKTMAAVAALWLALSVPHMHFASIFQREVVVVFLLLLALLWLTLPFTRMRFGLFTGLVYTALIHVDPQYLVLLPLFIVFILFFKSQRRFLNVQYLFLFLTTIVLSSLPWTIRNQLVYEQPIPVALEASRFFRPLKIFVTDAETVRTTLGERVSYATKTNRIENNTIEFWRFARFREGTAFDSGEIGSERPVEPVWSTRHNVVGILTYGILLPFFLIGVVAVFRERRHVGWVLAATTLLYFLMRAYLGGSERARLPMEPLIILLAFYGVVTLKRWIVALRQPTPVAGQEA